jgi:stringent starvation protein B
MDQADTPSTRPYLIRALHEWCTDNGFTPYLAVAVDASVQVPREFVQNNEIVLNTSYDATSNLRLGNDFVEFKARFGGVAREVLVPVDHVVAIYARENGQGMAFPPPEPASEGSMSAVAKTEAPSPKGLQVVSSTSNGMEENEPDPPNSGPAGRPALKRVK